MMLFNDHSISIFEPHFALRRLLNEPASNQPIINALQREIPRDESLQGSYKEGDVFPTRERDFHKYPPRIAVVFEADDGFKMQVFDQDVVGKLYEDIILQQDEIRPFFDCAPEDIIVLENYFGREMSRNFDDILAYIQKLQTARQEYEKHRQFVDDWMQQCGRLSMERERYLEKQLPGLLEEVEDYSRHFLSHLFDVVDTINQQISLELDTVFRPMNPQEQNLITFGLIYHILKEGLCSPPSVRRAIRFRNFLRDTHQFLCSSPTLVDDYCAYMEYPPIERTTINIALEKEGLLKERWISSADDLL